MGEHTSYGRCGGCGAWVPRDEMLCVNTNLYDAQNRKEVVRQRYCPGCFVVEASRARAHMWDHIVVSACDLAPLEDGSVPSNEVIWERNRLGLEQRRQQRSAAGATDMQEVGL